MEDLEMKERKNLFKRMMPMLVLEVLKNHTGDEQGLKVSQIVELLEQDYGVTAERKAISRILNDLYELTEISKVYSWKHPMPCTISFDSTQRSTANIRTNWRVYQQFEDVEVRLLMDAVQTVQGYPLNRIMGKLQAMGSPAVQNRKMADNRLTNSMMPIYMDAIMRAIGAERKIALATSDGQCVLSPYRMVLRKGVYYLIGFHHGKAELAHFQISDLMDVELLEASAKDYHTDKELSRWQYDFDRYLEYALMR